MEEIDIDAVGRWLLDNQDKQGTQEWELMSKAYMSEAVIEPPNQPEQQAPRFGAEFVRGIRNPVESLARSFSGDPAVRGSSLSRNVPLPTQADMDARAAMPDTMGSRMGEAFAETAIAAVPLGALASKIKPAAQGAQGIQAMLRNAVAGAGASFRQSPTRFIAAEGVAGATAGGGGFVAEQRYPDSDAARFVGEVLGGALPTVAGAATRGALGGVGFLARKTPVTGTVIRTWEQARESASLSSALPRVYNRFERAIEGTDANVVDARMDEELLPEARALMTPAQLSNTPGLLSLEKSLIDSTDTLRNKSVEQLSQLNQVIRDSFSRGASGSAQTAAERVERSYYNLLNERVAVAAQRANESIERLVPGVPAEVANRVARTELESALEAAVAQEKELFSRIVGSTPVTTTNARQAYRDVSVELGVAGRDELPELASRLFGREGSLGAETTVQEMRTAQSLFRSKARDARKGASPNHAQARIFDKMANAITDDIAQIEGDQANVVSDAVSFSRQKNEVFGQGNVGKILRGSADSGDLIPEALTLRNTLGLGGAGGAQAYDEIINAVGLAASTDGYRGFENTASMMETYVKNEFMRSVVRNGEVDMTRAATFIRNNEELLRRLPALSQEIQQATTAASGAEAAEALRRAGLKEFTNPLTSKAGVLINKGVTRAFEDVFSSGSPQREMQKLVDIVGADPTGEGLEGLKSGFFDYLLDSVETNGIVSGRLLIDKLKDPQFKGAAEALLERGELERLGVIARTAQRADAARAARPSVEGLSDTQLGRVAEVGLRVAGAALGRQLSGLMGGATIQTPAIISSALRDLGTSGVVNPAKALVESALTDEKLFREVLLNNVILGREMTAESTNLLNIWAYETLAKYGLESVKTEEETQQ